MLAGYDLGRWPSRDTVDIVLVDPAGRVLMIERGKPPYAGHGALPGGFVDHGEEPQDAAVRELAEETGLDVSADDVVFVMNSSDISRDPRGPIRTTVYAARVPAEVLDRAVGADDARDARPVHAHDLAGMKLAFDHRNLLAHALGMEQMRDRVNWRDAERLLAGVASDAARNWSFSDEVRAARAGRIASELAGHGIDTSVIGGQVVCRRQRHPGWPVHEMRWDTVMTGPAGRPIVFCVDGRKVREEPAPGPDGVAAQLADLFDRHDPRR
ncbi:ADP-ribose pyrophosphatase (plasmid) [Euzebya pacifica]|uniref:ADP-ribose pyrophosphatase n=1 Tax=Euzebya pacifica TaxID=1608957 RepID=A0A346Y615_9ACTN|nr:ADP-ribose pyrophosphatase [Euzebya pacifica]